MDPAQVIEMLRRLNTPTLANALDDLGIAGVVSGIAPAVPGLRCVGPAATALEITGPKGSFPAGDFRIGHIIDAARPGDVVVIANAGAAVSTWGGMASYSAQRRGIAGLVVDGGIRDREEIAGFGFPAFSRHMVPTPGKTRIRVESIGEPVVCGGVKVCPGDLIVADGTGILCIPAEAAETAATLATRFAEEDCEALAAMDNGMTFREALARFTKI